MISAPQKKPLAVIKVGGDIVSDANQRKGLAKNIAALTKADWQVIVLHGGGPQVTSLQKKLGIQANKIEGRRITDEPALSVVKQAIAGEVNVNLVSSLISEGVNAFGCHGASGKLITAVKRPPMLLTDNKTLVDFGEVGDVTGINTQLLRNLLDVGLVPVIATLGISNEGRIFNINADTTVAKITEMMAADLLLLVTGVGAIFRDLNDKSSRIKSIDSVEIEKLVSEKVIHSGMVPKVYETLNLLRKGTDRAVILSASEDGAFISAIHNTKEYGTTLTV
ncbi:Acetylglutamate kinase [gamma proteobacterium IMCC1989]|nr:Acetylglutamate kinase [gamma proteobacterium IMCC1989]